MGLLLARPMHETLAQVIEELLQFVGTAALRQGMFGLGHDVEIHQAQGQCGEAAAGTDQRAIDLGLRPVQQLVLRGDGLDRTAKGLDLVQRVAVGVEAVGPAAYAQTVYHTLQADFGLVPGSTPLRHALVPQAPLLRCG